MSNVDAPESADPPKSPMASRAARATLQAGGELGMRWAVRRRPIRLPKSFCRFFRFRGVGMRSWRLRRNTVPFRNHLGRARTGWWIILGTCGTLCSGSPRGVALMPFD